MAKAYVGIDLGTTNTTCAVALLADDGSVTHRQLPIQQPDIDPATTNVSWNRATSLPSAVWLADGPNVYTGTLCVEYADLISGHDGSRVVHGIKSELANRHWQLAHDGQVYGPAEISSCVLRTVWVAVLSQNLPEIAAIVITIPSSFSSTMRRQTLRAAAMAGLPIEKVSLLDEPIAALFSEHGDAGAPFARIQTEAPILVFDMGGGTVDVTVLSIRPAERIVDVHATSRYNQVAGDDLDLEIAAYLWWRLKQVTPGPEPILSRATALSLLRAGELVKKEVNRTVEPILNGNANELRNECRRQNLALHAVFDLPIEPYGTPALLIPVADVIDLVLPFVSISERERNFGRNIFTPIAQALERAGLRANRIEQVYLAGGGANFKPVNLELQSYFHSLSKALDPSYSVSAGAARFAAAADAGWRVSQTTSERIYLRRSGESFLEVLPDKLPVPCADTVPPRPLEGNDTIELPEESRSLRLEFFQGSHASDPQMSSVYTATLRFQRRLKAGTIVHSLAGRIDENKIYHFAIGLTEPDGRKISEMVEFSANSGNGLSPDAGPIYRLNNRAALTDLLGREPLRTQLHARVGTRRVRFLDGGTQEDGDTPPARPESLLPERVGLLQAMNEPWADAYIGDKYLPTRMRATLADLQSLTVTPGVVRDKKPHLELVDLYAQYGATVIRSLLDHSFLLYGTHDLEGKLGPIVDTLATDLAGHPERVQILLRDLNHHADSAFDVARSLIEIFLKATRDVPQIDQLILGDADFSPRFKLMAARVLGDPADAPSRYLRLLTLQLASRPGDDEFDVNVRPVIAALAGTRADGFASAMDAFNREDLGRAGALVLGSFSEEFCEWAAKQRALSARYVPALFQALRRIRSRSTQDDLVRRLVDQWSLDQSVKRAGIKQFQQFQRIAPTQFAAFRENLTKPTRKMLDDLLADAPAPDKELTRQVRDAAARGDAHYLSTLNLNDRALAVAQALASDVEDSAAVFLLGCSAEGNDDFLHKLLDNLLTPGSFEQLSESRQRLILEGPIVTRKASIAMLERIKTACRPPLRPIVAQLISEKHQAARDAN